MESAITIPEVGVGGERRNKLRETKTCLDKFAEEGACIWVGAFQNVEALLVLEQSPELEGALVRTQLLPCLPALFLHTAVPSVQLLHLSPS